MVALFGVVAFDGDEADDELAPVVKIGRALGSDCGGASIPEEGGGGVDDEIEAE